MLTAPEFDHLLLARLLSMAALIAATIEYAELIQRRAFGKQVEAVTRESGLQAMVRVFLADDG